MTVLLTCAEAISLLTDYRERIIPWTQRIQTRLHLRACPGCRRFFEELALLPKLFERFAAPDPMELIPIGEAALANAMARLHEPRNLRRRPETPVPAALHQLLASGADLPLRLMAQAHAALMTGAAPRNEPFLTTDVLAQLPPAESWKWRRMPGGVRRALLSAEANGPSLSLVFMPSGFTSGRHVHAGTESILVLEGELEHADRCLTNGDWVHLENGSFHAPHAFGPGCWCLIRDEGVQHFTGPFGWLKDLLAS